MLQWHTFHAQLNLLQEKNRFPVSILALFQGKMGREVGNKSNQRACFRRWQAVSHTCYPRGGHPTQVANTLIVWFYLITKRWREQRLGKRRCCPKSVYYSRSNSLWPGSGKGTLLELFYEEEEAELHEVEEAELSLFCFKIENKKQPFFWWKRKFFFIDPQFAAFSCRLLITPW